MGLNSFILNCEKDNEELRKDINYYKNITSRLKKENQELKKQLEENKNPLKGIFAQVNDDMLLRNCGAMQSEINGYKSQQKEFIKYLEDEIENSTFLKSPLETVLQKYKKIIGDGK